MLLAVLCYIVTISLTKVLASNTAMADGPAMDYMPVVGHVTMRAVARARQGHQLCAAGEQVEPVVGEAHAQPMADQP